MKYETGNNPTDRKCSAGENPDKHSAAAKRRPMTREELREAMEVLTTHVEPETSVAYHFTMLVLEVERVQAVAELETERRLRPLLPMTPDALDEEDEG